MASNTLPNGEYSATKRVGGSDSTMFRPKHPRVVSMRIFSQPGLSGDSMYWFLCVCVCVAHSCLFMYDFQDG